MRIRNHVTLFLIGASAYPLIEILYRGRTHWSMSLLGGLVLAGIGKINLKFRHKSLLWRSVLSAVYITSMELLTGIVVNRLLKLDVWDYSLQKFNLLGQICPIFTLIWLGFSAAICWGLDWSRKRYPNFIS